MGTVRHKRIEPWHPPKKTVGQQFREDIFTVFISLVLYYVIVKFFGALFSPFKYLFMSQKALWQEKIEKAREKVEARNILWNRYSAEKSDTLRQCRLHPDDPDYKEWLNGLKNGYLVDSHMRWAPEVYDMDDNLDNQMTGEFLDYLNNQVMLHMRLGMHDRMVFTKTIRDYFPEFTPKLSIMADEIEEFREELKQRMLKKELQTEIESTGVPDILAQELIEKGYTAKQIKENIAVIKKCLEKEYCYYMCDFCMKYGYDSDDSFAESVNTLLFTVGPDAEDIAVSLIKGDITPEELREVATRAADWTNSDTRKMFFRHGYEELMNKKLLSK